MIKFKHHYCKAHMARYLSGDLSDTTRRRVARFIDECQDCYEEFVNQRALTDQLERNLPSLGRPDVQRLDNIWLSLQTELAPAGAPKFSQNFYSPRSHAMGYGLVLVALALALLLPVSIGLHSSLQAVDLPPRPPAVRLVTTPEAEASVRQINVIPTHPLHSHSGPTLKNTPLPFFAR